MATQFLHAPTTAEELFERPDDGYRYELVEGSLVRMTPTGAEHGVVTARVAYVLQEYALRHGGVCCGAETGFVLRRAPDVVRAPDAAFVAAERIPETGIPRSYWPFAPDLAVEVPSPSDRAADVQAKIVDYFAAGTRLVWVVEPATRSVRVYRSPKDVEVIEEDGELTGGDVLPGFRCAVKRLFGP
ncbi:MAG: Uma2 family endonuclease [Acidobacteria bacterium]|nr:Uma2 family endonuclease [Acidobacteriota bacterium]